MPYIITTTDPQHVCLSTLGHTNVEPIVTRHAVATLDEAHNYMASVVHRIDPTRNYGLKITAIPESGGTVGPLPDGTVITVEQVT